MTKLPSAKWDERYDNAQKILISVCLVVLLVFVLCMPVVRPQGGAKDTARNFLESYYSVTPEDNLYRAYFDMLSAPPPPPSTAKDGEEYSIVPIDADALMAAINSDYDKYLSSQAITEGINNRVIAYNEEYAIEHGCEMRVNSVSLREPQSGDISIGDTTLHYTCAVTLIFQSGEKQEAEFPGSLGLEKRESGYKISRINPDYILTRP